MITFKKIYADESLCDLERDIIESFDPAFNIDVQGIPKDEHGFSPGSWLVTVEYIPDGE